MPWKTARRRHDVLSGPFKSKVWNIQVGTYLTYQYHTRQFPTHLETKSELSGKKMRFAPIIMSVQQVSRASFRYQDSGMCCLRRTVA